MGSFTNTDTQTRTWPTMVNAGTGRTLCLAPGQSADVEVPAGFSDPWLKPARATAKSAPKPALPTSSPGTPEADAVKPDSPKVPAAEQ